MAAAKELKRSFLLLCSFWRHAYGWHLLLAAVFCLCAPLIVSFGNLSESGCAAMMEKYGLFAGLLLMTPLAMPEQDAQLWQLEKSKACPMEWLMTLRILGAAFVLGIAVVGFEAALAHGNSSFDPWLLGRGAYVEYLFLGSISFFFGVLTNQAVLGYMVGVFYYLASLGGYRKLLRVFSLMQMQRGSYDFWPWMLGGAAVFLLAGTLLFARRRR